MLKLDKKLVLLSIIFTIGSITLAYSSGDFYLKSHKIEHEARVIDGDSLILGEHNIRLQGIDAMEDKQLCWGEKGEKWECGKEASKFLRKLVGEERVVCYIQSRDKYNRLIGVCFVGEKDLAEQVIREGLAIALPWFTEHYVPYQRRARQEKVGVWSGKFDKPSKWRKKNPK